MIHIIVLTSFSYKARSPSPCPLCPRWPACPQVGRPSLPEDVNRASNINIKGPLVLQVPCTLTAASLPAMVLIVVFQKCQKG